MGHIQEAEFQVRAIETVQGMCSKPNKSEGNFIIPAQELSLETQTLILRCKVHGLKTNRPC